MTVSYFYLSQKNNNKILKILDFMLNEYKQNSKHNSSDFSQPYMIWK